MKKYFLLIAALSLCLAVIPGCSGTKSVKMADGKNIEIYILSDRGNPDDMTEKQYLNRVQVGEWMEPDLVRILNRAGYKATLIEKPEEYTPGTGKYLLKVSIVSYNPGSAAARILVGYGAGATSMDNHYELYGEGKEPLLSYDDGVGSSRGWRQVAQKLNQNALERISQKLAEVH